MLKLRALGLTLLIWGVSATLQAQEVSAPITDVRVLIDISGSMRSNDPQNLRQPAMDLLVQMVPEGSRAGVWTFGQWVNMLVPHKPVTPEWRTAASRQQNGINSHGLYTNIPEALRKATYDADRIAGRYDVNLILLTDGMVDVDRSPKINASAREQLLSELLPPLRDAGVRIHTVALSENADRELLETLALQTGGLAAVANNAEDLNRVFLQMFETAVPQEEVPLKDNRFLIDSSVEEFTALAFQSDKRVPVKLRSPDGKTYSASSHGDDMRWYEGDGFTLVTVQAPFEGEWLLMSDIDPSNRVSVVSNLTLAVDRLPGNLFRGEPLSVHASLQEKGQVITDRDLLSVITAELLIAQGDTVLERRTLVPPVPEQGMFGGSLTLDQPGDYTLTVTVDGRTFERRFRHHFTLRELFSYEVENGDQVRLRLLHPKVDPLSVSVEGMLTAPSGQQSPVTAQATPGEWLLTPQMLEAGTHQLQLMANVTAGDQFLRYSPDPIALEGPVNGLLVVPVEPPPVVEAIVEPMPPEPVVEPEPEPVMAAPVVEEPTPVEEPAPVIEEPTPPVEPEVQEEASSVGDYLMYGGIGLVNLLLLGGAYFGVRKLMSSGAESLSLDDDEDDDEEVPAKPAKAEKAAKPGKAEAAAAAAAASAAAAAELNDLPDAAEEDDLAMDLHEEIEPMDDIDDFPLPDHFDLETPEPSSPTASMDEADSALLDDIDNFPMDDDGIDLDLAEESDGDAIPDLPEDAIDLEMDDEHLKP